MLDFRDAGEFLDVNYKVFLDGEIISGDDIDLESLKAKEEKWYDLSMPELPKGIITILFQYKVKNNNHLYEKGEVLGFDNFIIKNGVDNISSVDKIIKSTINEQKFYVEETVNKIKVINNEFIYNYNKNTGSFDFIQSLGETFIDDPMKFIIWRAPTDNDRKIKNLWIEAGFNQITTRVYNSKIKEFSNRVEITSDLSLIPPYRERVLNINVTWSIYSEGLIKCYVKGDKNMKTPYLPRFGVELKLNKSYEGVSYFGFGPYENYVDKNSSCYLGRFNSKVSEMHEDYIRPQENGAHHYCREVAINNEKGKVYVLSENDFAFNVSHFSLNQLTNANHNFELHEEEATYLIVDYKQSGIGSNSCGPDLDEEYRLNEKEFSYDFYLKFVKDNIKDN